MKKKVIKIGKLHKIVKIVSLDSSYNYTDSSFAVYDILPFTSTKKLDCRAKVVDSIARDTDFFCLLETNQINNHYYHKVLTKNGIMGYLYVNGNFFSIAEAEE